MLSILKEINNKYFIGNVQISDILYAVNSGELKFLNQDGCFNLNGNVIMCPRYYFVNKNNKVSTPAKSCSSFLKNIKRRKTSCTDCLVFCLNEYINNNLKKYN